MLGEIDQKSLRNLRGEMIESVDPLNLLPHLYIVFTTEETHRLRTQIKDDGTKLGMMYLLDVYEKKAKNLLALSHALRFAGYDIWKTIGKYYIESEAHISQGSNKEMEVENRKLKEMLEFEREKHIEALAELTKQLNVSFNVTETQKEFYEKRIAELNQQINEFREINANLESKNESVPRENDELKRKSESTDQFTSAQASASITKQKGTVYVIGGWDSKNTELKSVEIIDPIQLQWIKFGPEMQKGRHSFAGVAKDDQLMVFGGVELCSCESLNTITQIWSPLPDMKEKRDNHNAVGFNDMIYIIGGRVDYEVSNTVIIFNPAHSSWITGTSMNIKRQHAAAASLDSSIVVTGGYNLQKSTMNTCEMMDPRQKEWINIGSMNENWDHHVLINYNGRLLVMGGRNENDKSLATVEEYEARMDKWNYINKLKSERSQFAAVVMP